VSAETNPLPRDVTDFISPREEGHVYGTHAPGASGAFGECFVRLAGYKHVPPKGVKACVRWSQSGCFSWLAALECPLAVT